MFIWAVAAAVAAGCCLGIVDVKLYQALKRITDHASERARIGLVVIFLAIFGAGALYGLLR